MRREEREVKQERSISVQGRVDIVELAELCVYFEREGVRVKSMSQLVGWSISLLREVMSRNGMIREIGSIARAHQLFEERGLYQRALKSRNMQKIATAVRFEGMRESGYDPIETGRQFGVLHNENSVVPFDVEKVATHYGSEIEEALRRAAEEKEKDRLNNKWSEPTDNEKEG